MLDLYSRVGAALEDDHHRRPRAAGVQGGHGDLPDAGDHRAQRERYGSRHATLTAELKAYDIKVVDVFITNLGFSQLYSDAIEQKQKQVQDAQRAQARVKQIEAEARQKVAMARARRSRTSPALAVRHRPTACDVSR